MQSSITKIEPTFIKPYPQEALGGKEGLTLTDIAKSLGARANDFRKTFKRSLLKKIESLGLVSEEVVSVSDSNGLQHEEFVVDVRTAKWIATQSRTELGQRYALYLIDLESKITELESKAQNDPILQMLLTQASARAVQIDHEERLTKIESSSALAVDPYKFAQLKAKIAERARASGSATYAGKIINVLKVAFGTGAKNIRLQDQVCLYQFDDIMEFLDNYVLSDRLKLISSKEAMK